MVYFFCLACVTSSLAAGARQMMVPNMDKPEGYIDIQRNVRIQAGIRKHIFAAADRDYLIRVTKNSGFPINLEADQSLDLAAEVKLFPVPRLLEIIDRELIACHRAYEVPSTAGELGRALWVDNYPRAAEKKTTQLMIHDDMAKIDAGEKLYLQKAGPQDQLVTVWILASKKHLDKADCQWGLRYLKALVAKRQGPQKQYFECMEHVFNARNPS